MHINFRRVIAALVAVIVTGGFVWAGGAADKNAEFALSIVHVNDTHSMFEGASQKLILDLEDGLKGKGVNFILGDFARVLTAIKAQQAQKIAKDSPAYSADQGLLTLHAGDIVQGSLYYTKFGGEADMAFWNLAGIDAATLGNHEFDRGPAELAKTLLPKAKFPVVDANLDTSKNADLAALKIPPYIIKKVGGQNVGIIGLTTQETAFISSPGTVAFSEYVPAVAKAVKELEAKKVNKIVLLTHLGWDEDLALAPKLHGVDVIVGGHSHSLAGDFSSVGLGKAKSYPAEVKDVNGFTTLVVTSWQWAEVLGRVDVKFDADGHVTAYQGSPKLVSSTDWFQVLDVPNKAGETKRVQFTKTAAGVEIMEYDGKGYNTLVTGDAADFYKRYYNDVLAVVAKQTVFADTAKDAQAAKLIDTFAVQIADLKKTVISNATADLKRGPNIGPGPIAAASMLAKTGAQVAMVNPGGMRIDVPQGDITVARVYELMPFGNTITLVTLKGSELQSSIEDMVNFSVGRYGADPTTNPYTYVAGVAFDLNPTLERGKRVSNVKIVAADGTKTDLDPNATYTFAVNNYMASGGDLNDTLKTIKTKLDTGYIDAEAFMEYIKGKSLADKAPLLNIIK